MYTEQAREISDDRQTSENAMMGEGKMSSKSLDISY
jgi:hypothetical protein